MNPPSLEQGGNNKVFQRSDINIEVNEALRNIPDSTQIAGGDDGQQGEGIIVAIIDTWPVGADTARPDYHRVVIQAKIDELGRLGRRASARRLQQVLDKAPVGNFRDVIKDSELIGLCPRRVECNGATYEKMNFADHGLFIAGLIREIVPRATFRIYRAFNPFGCSTFELVTKAVRQAVNDANGSPLVINCSWYFGPPMHVFDKLCDANRWEFAYINGRRWYREVVEDTPSANKDQVPASWLRSLSGSPGPEEEGKVNSFRQQLTRTRERDEIEALRQLFAPLWKGRVLPVAAAGNDSCREADEPRVAPPRVPASFDEVLGVSAVVPGESAPASGNPEIWSAADYSNNDDVEKIRDDGISAVGGNYGAPGNADRRTLLGPYVSDLPSLADPASTTPNEFGHALWAGTSFATPVVSGIAACVWSELLATRPATTGEEILRAVVGSSVAVDDWTPGERQRLIDLLQK